MSEQTRWEYTTVRMQNLSIDTESDALDSLGCRGWELVSVVQTDEVTRRAYFKRPASARR